MGFIATKIVVLVFDFIIIGTAISGIVMQAVWYPNDADYNGYLYYPSGVLLAGIILGIVGCFLNNTILLLISLIISYVLAAGEIISIIIVWVAYDYCDALDGTNYCNIDFLAACVGITIVCSIGFVLLILSASLSLRLRRLIRMERSGGILTEVIMV